MIDSDIHLQRPTVPVPERAVKRLHEYLDREIVADILVHEHQLMLALVSEARKITISDDYVKSPILCGTNRQVARDNNCTDTAATQLAIAESVGLSVIGKYNGNHASTIVRSTGFYWNINDETSVGVKHSSKITEEFSHEKIAATQTALDQLETHDGAYVYLPSYGGNWQVSLFKGRGVRRASPSFGAKSDRRTLHDGFVLVKTPLAYEMLHAIDILGTLRNNITSEQVALTYALAKQALKELVPLLPKRY